MSRTSSIERLKMEFDEAPLLPDFVVESVARPAMAEITNHTEALPGRDGTRLRRHQLGSRTIEVTLRQVKTNVAKLSDARAYLREMLFDTRRFFNRNETRKLYLSDQPTRYDNVILDGLDVELKGNTMRVSVTFLCPEGFSRDLRETEREMKDASTHLAYHADLEAPIRVEGIATAGTVVFSDFSTGDRVTVSGVRVGAAIVIDSETETVTEDGRLVMTKVSPDSDFVWIRRVDNELTCSGLRDVRLFYQGRWL